MTSQGDGEEAGRGEPLVDSKEVGNFDEVSRVSEVDVDSRNLHFNARLHRFVRLLRFTLLRL